MKHPTRCKRAMGVTVMLALLASGCGERTGVSSADVERIATLQARLSKLQTEVTRARDVSAIKKLQRSYGYYLDKGLADDLADLFTDNEPSAGYEAGTFIGKKSIRNALRHLGPDNSLPEGKMMTHMQVQGVVHVAEDGNTAKARWRAIAWTATKLQARLQEGPYEVEYVKEGGVWKIKQLQWYQTFGAPYEGGWVALQPPPGKPDAAALLRASQIPKPDAPSTNKTWPEAVLPPYHYTNPVSGR